MGTLALDSGSSCSDIYLRLGLKELGKRVLQTPRVLTVLSSLLERLVQKNEILIESNELVDSVTIFHGLRPPPLSIRQYIDRIFKYAGCSPSCFVVAYIYVNRFLQHTDTHLTSLNVHRLLITCVMVAAKFIDDVFFNNAYYAKVGGVSTAELNRLEVKFLFSIDFRLQVSIKSFGQYCSELEKEASEGLQIERPIQACRAKESCQASTASCAATTAQ